MIQSGDALEAAIDAVVPLFQSGMRFVLTTHINPDGDGLGSQLALAAWLRDRGKEVKVINHSPTPAVYRFLDPARMIREFDAAHDASAIASADLIVIMDTNRPDRLRTMQDAVMASPAMRVCIDHHLDPAPFAQHYLIDDNATSTGEIVYRLLLRLHGPDLTSEMAADLYAAIMTDTGSFRYPRVNTRTHEIAAHLIDRGADPVAIYSEIYERWSRGRIHLLGEMLASLETSHGGRVAHVAVTQDMLRRTQTEEEDTENFTTYPMSVDGVRIGILFLELDRGVKISFRSRGNIPANALAAEFGGNGHLNAAGARIENGALAAVRKTVVDAAAKYLPPLTSP
ncbi:MAG: bifunctional oligoribonuclease/PAP phosphatase NrnA [Bacteroidota bacterium]